MRDYTQQGEYNRRIVDDDPNFPYGRPRGRVNNTPFTGTPFGLTEQEDSWGFHQALLTVAGFTPDNTPEQVGSSQLLDAIRYLLTQLAQAATGLSIHPQYGDAEDGQTVAAGVTAIQVGGVIYQLSAPVAASGVLTLNLPTDIDVGGTIYNLDRNSIVETENSIANINRSILAVDPSLTQGAFSYQQTAEFFRRSSFVPKRGYAPDGIIFMYGGLSEAETLEECNPDDAVIYLHNDGTIEILGYMFITPTEKARLTSSSNSLVLATHLGTNICLVDNVVYTFLENYDAVAGLDLSTGVTTLYFDNTTQYAEYNYQTNLGSDGLIYTSFSRDGAQITFDPSTKTFGTTSWTLPSADYGNEPYEDCYITRDGTKILCLPDNAFSIGVFDVTNNTFHRLTSLDSILRDTNGNQRFASHFRSGYLETDTHWYLVTDINSFSDQDQNSRATQVRSVLVSIDKTTYAADYGIIDFSSILSDATAFSWSSNTRSMHITTVSGGRIAVLLAFSKSDRTNEFQKGVIALIDPDDIDSGADLPANLHKASFNVYADIFDGVTADGEIHISEDGLIYVLDDTDLSLIRTYDFVDKSAFSNGNYWMEFTDGRRFVVSSYNKAYIFNPLTGGGAEFIVPPNFAYSGYAASEDYLCAAPYGAMEFYGEGLSTQGFFSLGLFDLENQKYGKVAIAPNDDTYACVFPVNCDQIVYVRSTTYADFEFSDLDPSVPDGTEFYVTVPLPNGSFIGVPYESSPFVNFFPKTFSQNTFGAVPANTTYQSGQSTPEGIVYCAPYNGTQLAILDTNNLTASYIDVSEGIPSLGHTANWVGGTIGKNGKLYFAPVNAAGVLEVDPTDNSYRMIGDLGAETNKYSCISALHNGELALIPMDPKNVLYLDIDNESFRQGPMINDQCRGAAYYGGLLRINTLSNGADFCIDTPTGPYSYCSDALVNFG